MKCCLIEKKYCSYLSNTSHKWTKFRANCNIWRNWALFQFGGALFCMYPLIQGYLRSCVCVYIHVTCRPLEHTACSKSKHGHMLCILPKHSTARDLRSNRTTRPITTDLNASLRSNWNTFCLSHMWRCIPCVKYLQLQQFVVDLEKMLQLYTQIVI